MSKREEKKEEVVSEELAKEFEEAKEEFNEMTGGETPPKKKKNYTAIIVIAAVLVVIGSIFGVTKLAKGYKKKTYGDTSTTVEKDEKAKKVTEKLSDNQKELVGIKKEDTKTSVINDAIKKEESKNTTDAYKKYEKLTDKQKAAQKVVPSKEKSPYKSVEEVKEVIEYDESGLPNKYNLNSKLSLTVPNQKGYDLGWAFASMKTAETNYALNHNNKMPDFSEMHLDYFTTYDNYGYRNLHSGGSYNDFENYVIENGGIVSESNMPYAETNDVVKVVNNKREYFVNTSIYYPDYYYLDYDYTNGTKNEIWENAFKDYIGVLKYHLVNYGALYATILSPTPGESYFNSKTNALYFDGQYNDNYSYYFNREAVTIVGYDDTYSKDNFNSGSKPNSNGAFIAMVSQGKDSYNKGYIYISYEDMVVTNDVHGVISTELEDAVKVSSITSNIIREKLLEKFGYAVIEYNGEQYIPQNVLNKGVSLDLSNMNLTEEDIDQIGVFNNISSLNLSHNNLSDFGYLINRLGNVSSLDLSDNNYNYIPLELPYREIYHLNLKGNNIANVSGLSDLNVHALELSSSNMLYGFQELTSLYSLIISDSQISLSQFSDLNDLYYLDVTNSDLGNDEASLPQVSTFICDTCQIGSLDILNLDGVEVLELPNNELTNLNGIEKYSKLVSLNVSDNKITDISGLDKLENLSTLDLSYNPDISDYTTLDNIFSENDYPTYEELTKEWEDAPSKDDIDIKYYYRDDYETLNLSNNNISDISKFNNIDVYSLDLSGNIIEDVSGFNNENIMEINLAYNKITNGLEKLSEVRGLNLSSNGITDINFLSDFDKLDWINLSSNDVKDITPLNKLKKLYLVSLENNVNQEGTLDNKRITSLNVANCNLDNLDRYNVKNLNVINISNNKNLENNLDALKNNNQEYLTLFAEGLELNYETINELKSKDDHIYVEGATLVYKANKENNRVKIDDEKLAKTLFDYVRYSGLSSENGYVGRLAKYITIENEDLDNVTINTGDVIYKIEY